jgi:hypothetical protein
MTKDAVAEVAAPKKTLGRATVKEIFDRPIVSVSMDGIAGWDGVEVKLQAMNGELRFETEQEWMAAPKGSLPPDYKERVLARCIVDDEGKLVFGTLSADTKTGRGTVAITDDDVKTLRNFSGAAVDRIYSRAAKINGLDSKSVDEAAKN